MSFHQNIELRALFTELGLGPIVGMMTMMFNNSCNGQKPFNEVAGKPLQ